MTGENQTKQTEEKPAQQKHDPEAVAEETDESEEESDDETDERERELEKEAADLI